MQDRMLIIAYQVPINDHSLPQTYVIPGPKVWKGTASMKKARNFAA